MDNGFLLFNNVEIPHISMLARHSRVDPETNTYIKPKSAASVYGTMTWVRSVIVSSLARICNRVLTILVGMAIRRCFGPRCYHCDQILLCSTSVPRQGRTARRRWRNAGSRLHHGVLSPSHPPCPNLCTSLHRKIDDGNVPERPERNFRNE